MAEDKAIRIGFTGTRIGMMAQQEARVKGFLLAEAYDILEAHHGDCIGADADFHRLCLEQHIPIILHPSNLSKQRAYCTGAKRELYAKPSLDRNRDIIDSCDMLIACPKTDQNELRSGTWATIRYAMKTDKKIITINPDGTTNFKFTRR